MMKTKREWRKQISDLKKQYSLEEKKEKSIRIWEEVERDDHFRKAHIVLVYWSMPDEVYTHDFVKKWASEKTILLPCVKGEELEIYYFEGEEALCPGEAYGILEPTGNIFSLLEKIDLVIVPGMAFSKQGDRLGRGKGYYDKLLKEASAAWKIGVCFDFQLVEELPMELHDVKMDCVVYG